MRGMTSQASAETTAVLAQIEQYYDTVPRRGALAEELGPLTLFVRHGQGWPFYARPTLDRPGRIGPADVHRVRERQREIGIPETFEWVDEVTPELRNAAAEAGLAVHEHPLMLLDPQAALPTLDQLAAGLDGALGEGLTARIITPRDPALASALAVPRLAFAEPGTKIGEGGLADLAQMVSAKAHDGSVQQAADRIEVGWTVIAAAVDGQTALSAGQHQPIDKVSEIVGVGTLPTARRRGLAAAVTAALAVDARSRGVQNVFLSADDANVARIYGRLGFRQIATALIAEPAVK
jgi:ribosomal protein S18 acetylase RimI-like enzyme